jgi:hypothetical protein
VTILSTAPTPTHRIVRFYENPEHEAEVLETGLSLEEAMDYCRGSETSSRSATSEEALKRTKEKGRWFDGFQLEAETD